MRQESDTGLSLSSLSALAVISVHGPMTLGTLADLEKVSPPTITRVVRRLEADGLVQLIAGEEDRRHKFVQVTDVGARLLATSRERKNAWLTSQMSELSGTDIKALRRVVGLFEGLVGAEVTR
ncbi:MAG: MarR family transcriptional regulator [Microthrixaceae bacterium]